MEDRLTKLKSLFENELKSIDSTHGLNELRARFLGKKSPLQEFMKKMPLLDDEDRKNLGKKLNEFKRFVEAALAIKLQEINNLAVLKQVNKEDIDVTLQGRKFPIGHKHILDQLWSELEDFFIGLGYEIAEGPEIETDLYNFEMLNTPKDHPARDMQDSFYINSSQLLRTHTSPVQVRTMLKAAGAPVKIVCPGIVYRRDSDDATHSHQFMQIEGLAVDRNITMSDLKGTLTLLMKTLFGSQLDIRFRPSFFPFTEPSVEVDVTCFKCFGQGCALCKQSGWIEILGAGMVNPKVLKMSGYNPDLYQGFAFGMGIERVAMLRYGIDDIRLFYSNDPRFLEQF